MASGFSLKDDLFNPSTIGDLAAQFRATGAIDADRFEAAVLARLPELELKARIAWIAECLLQELPGNLPEAAPILRAALPPPLDPTRTDDDFGRFIHAPLGEVVTALGLEEHPDLSLDLMEEITQRFSMEMSIRAFLIRYPDLVLERMEDWAQHPNYHVRRLVSEGTRPKLPWAPAIGLDPDRALPLLDRLHADPTRYVTRSVANHLNDITKIRPELALDRLNAWGQAGRQAPRELQWMTGHALRGLVKAGDPRAMALLGFDPDAPIKLLQFDIPAQARIGDVMELAVTLHCDVSAGAIVDYVFWRRRANGELAPKVHKLKTLQLAAGTPQTIVKRHGLKGDATTYRLYPGAQKIALQVNGRVLGEAGFELLDN
ncbi:hypothetical protein [Marinibacterium profundimaris]|uniref:DNA alkylation repair protein n=1 Tax=Marinibacterium profundimaris TaxID=1679460 RepID=A0A225NX25_9RHOB|nr:hypothetical protein [Marinibacterium profundimaris]OWU77877.1 hypothetical protein ATO3_04380 [Marinibacterium profundimaris]